MSRKPKKGYFVKGQFVAEGSELDLELKAELKGTWDSSRTDMKRESDALQKLGEDLLDLRSDLLARLHLSDKLLDALIEARRITNFEGKRRQMQYIGKIMRKLEESQIAAIHAAMEEQRGGSPTEKLIVMQTEQWRDRLMAEDGALAEWLDSFPATESQQIRALIRQARKDVVAAPADAAPADASAPADEEAAAAAPRKASRAYRELFALLRDQLSGSQGFRGAPQPAAPVAAADDSDD
ncbi:MAG: ribosome biogenesis factor YjgA [Comamonas sp.]